MLGVKPLSYNMKASMKDYRMAENYLPPVLIKWQNPWSRGLTP